MIIILANGFLVFSIFLIFTKYKNIKLGGPSAIPKYSYTNWIAMLFSAGLGIGLLFLWCCRTYNAFIVLSWNG